MNSEKLIDIIIPHLHDEPDQIKLQIAGDVRRFAAEEYEKQILAFQTKIDRANVSRKINLEKLVTSFTPLQEIIDEDIRLTSLIFSYKQFKQVLIARNNQLFA